MGILNNSTSFSFIDRPFFRLRLPSFFTFRKLGVFYSLFVSRILQEFAFYIQCFQSHDNVNNIFVENI